MIVNNNTKENDKRLSISPTELLQYEKVWSVDY